jgi:hypothetical protein
MLKKNAEFDQFIYNILPYELVDVVYSYEKTKYQTHYNNILWEDVEDMLGRVLVRGPDMCNHLFEIFQDIEIHFDMFYPNINNDISITPRRLGNEIYCEISGTNFNLFDWFYVDYIKSPGRRKLYYYEDDCTNYYDMAFMMISILQKFDTWFWNNYIGSTNDENELLKNITRIYDVLDKYSYMNDNEFNDDSSIEDSSKLI